ncbi:heparanase-like [Copidosoma floridanum]|uniref:heparanase-like n=1 Tax=Copidosoma floridanum TaxID=29053 RepID=UPI0006C9AAB5|nr:heparanase-like [Copidosoma floridanum]
MQDVHIVKLEKRQDLLSTVSKKFLSFGLDSSLLRNMKELPIGDQRFINLAHHLSPAYVRIGGTAADCLYFNETDAKKNISEVEINSEDIRNFTITSNDFASLYDFTQKVNLSMMFDLNVLLRNTDGSWNSDNAREIIRFAKRRGMELDWQMGNEPNSFLHVFNVTVPPEQLARDYTELRSILRKLGFENSIVVGPEANHIGDENQRGVKYVETFLENINDSIDYVSWHQYYLNGHVARAEDFIDSKVFNKLPAEIDVMTQSLNTGIPMWLSETGSAYGSGAPDLSDKYVAGFLWLDKLGVSAKAGINVVVRQSFFGGHYAMVGPDLSPNPDWWIAVLFKRFVSEKVLNLEGPSNFGNLRFYAHCAVKQLYVNDVPTIAVYGMNLNEQKSSIYFQDLPEKSTIHAYILTSDALQSRNIFLNEKLLELRSDGSLPLLTPKIVDKNQAIILPPYSMIFLLIQNFQVPACLE